MNNKLDNDPQEYCEEWFNVAIPGTKEFQLPNLSNSSSSCHPIKNSHLDIMPTLPHQILPIQTNLPSLDSVQDICNVGNQQTIPICAVAAAPAMVEKEGKEEEHQAYRSSLTTINTSISYSHNSSTNLGLKGIVTLENQGSSLDILPTSSVHSVIGSSSSSCLYSSGSIHTRCHQEGLLNGLSNLGRFSRGSISLANQDTHESAAPTRFDKLEVDETTTLRVKEQKTCATLFDIPSGGHKCSVCNMRFASGNALGGHMSAHAKRRKMEALRTGVLFKSESSAFHGAGHGQIKP